MTRYDEIKASYRKLGNRADFYDGIITRSTLIGKLVDSVVWGLNWELAAKWVNYALSPVPEDFTGKLLEVPAGSSAAASTSRANNGTRTGSCGGLTNRRDSSRRRSRRGKV